MGAYIFIAALLGAGLIIGEWKIRGLQKRIPELSGRDMRTRFYRAMGFAAIVTVCMYIFDSSR